MSASPVALNGLLRTGARSATSAAVHAVLRAWPATAAWDFVCASALGVFAYHSTVPRLWQGVASTVIGPGALQMGAAGVMIGLALHLAVALVWTTIFVTAVVAWPALRRLIARPGGAFAVACVYGPVIWLAMSLVVIPLATGRPPNFGFRWWVQIVAHVPFVTLPLVFVTRWALGVVNQRKASNLPEIAAAAS